MKRIVIWYNILIIKIQLKYVDPIAINFTNNAETEGSTWECKTKTCYLIICVNIYLFDKKKKQRSIYQYVNVLTIHTQN